MEEVEVEMCHLSGVALAFHGIVVLLCFELLDGRRGGGEKTC